ncbi:dolichyl-phosphate-mannose-protein mannosyltransferase [Halosimplex carlsbadense 2-9-1]|uniref:Dolichyl-phosphate-mannose-protein mannosyltransferase n=1 Tax=Halosimplex carlsbadense 2-9-1 TaxID=797114 RepID=M0CLD4_9EURY|nr:glycosyltransferase family 39 protein [Halosimplex carlsbadense]ELZ24080.1 dolichyl-phosphate-mannose-protein mannosyltransferase [Halosimplex carlsbadense 2-9-1]
MTAVRGALRDATGRVLAPLRADLEADPYLPYLLAVALATCGFGVWFRVPNFAAPDEYSRLIQPMKVAGGFVADPSFEAIRAGITDGRALGATFYLYALTLAPVFLVVLLTGRLGEFAALGTIQSRWELWHAAPAWFWTGAVLVGRFVNVALGVGCVYLTYRLGVELRDRFAGRLAALLLALSVGFVSQAHLVGEDVPMLFLLLATVLLANRYVQEGRTADFLLGALTGGLAIAFKLNGGVAAVVLGVALLVRAARSDDPLAELLRPRVVVGGLVVGAVAVVVGIPSVLVGGVPELVARITDTVGSKTGKTGGFAAPIEYWFGYQYLRGLGLPLFVGALAGVAATAWRLVARRGAGVHPLTWLLLVTIAFPLVVYARWEFVRLRHLVPTFPALFALLAAEVSRRRPVATGASRDRGWRVLRVGLAVLLLTAGGFVVAAEYEYVTDPRDQAADWIETNTAADATVEVYENSIADVGVPHGRETSHFSFPEERATNDSDLVLNESSYTAWMLAMPDRQPEYIQLTDGDLDYVDPDATEYAQYPERRAYLRALLDGEYEYRVVATFGDPPIGERESAADRLVDAALRPAVEGRQRGVVLLERLNDTGSRASQSVPPSRDGADPKVYRPDGNRNR